MGLTLDGGAGGRKLWAAIGGQATDFVLLIMNPRGAKAILSSKVKLARTWPQQQDQKAGTLSQHDATMRAEILSYSRSRGLFAGISLEGSTLRPDKMRTKNCTAKK